jgi:hypothetical protein
VTDSAQAVSDEEARTSASAAQRGRDMGGSE